MKSSVMEPRSNLWPYISKHVWFTNDVGPGIAMCFCHTALRDSISTCTQVVSVLCLPVSNIPPLVIVSLWYEDTIIKDYTCIHT